MPDTVKVPGFGQVGKGKVAGIAIGGVAVAGYLIYRQQKKTKTTAAQTATAASGYGYGSSQGTYGYGYYGYGEPGITYGYGASGGFYPQGYYGYGTVGGGGTPNTTNAQWSQAAINQLSGEGYDGQAVSGALGAYLLGQPVDASQVNIVQSAIAVEGYPPEPGANGYPPAIMHQGTGGGGGGGGQGTTVKVPQVMFATADAAHDRLKADGLKWTENRAHGKVTKQSPKAGTTVKKGSSVALTLRPL